MVRRGDDIAYTSKYHSTTANGAFDINKIEAPMPKFDEVEWISIKDRQPESPAMWVICYAILPGNRKDYWIAQYIQDKWTSRYTDFKSEYITHWMYLPEEPR